MMRQSSLARRSTPSRHHAAPAVAGNIDQSKVSWVKIEPSARIAALAERRVDVVGDHTAGMPFHEMAMGVGNAVMKRWADNGFDLYKVGPGSTTCCCRANCPAACSCAPRCAGR
jgi:NitT/TauT family transport system substrate-binding protein